MKDDKSKAHTDFFKAMMLDNEHLFNRPTAACIARQVTSWKAVERITGWRPER